MHGTPGSRHHQRVAAAAASRARRAVTLRPRVALHGAGPIAAVHAMAARALGFPVVAVSGLGPSRSSDLATRIGSTSVAAAALPTGPETITVIATPPAAHVAAAVTALDAGGSVLVEKPLCRSLAEADLLVAAAERARGELLYAENIVYSPLVERLLLEASLLGPATYLEARALQPRPASPGSVEPEWGGGALFDLGVHPLALVVLLARPATVVQVSAKLTAGPAGSDIEADLRLMFSDGTQARVVASTCSGPETVWDVQKAGRHGVVRAELFPTPMLESDGEEIPLGPRRADFATDYGFVGQLDALRTAASGGTPPITDARFGRDILDIVCAAYASASSGGPQAVPFTGDRAATPWELWRG